MEKTFRWLTKPSLIFTYFVLLEVGVVSLFIIQQRFPLHDTFFKLSFQYYILNHIAVYKEVPYWIPYFVQGSPTAWWMEGLAGVLVHALTLLPQAVARVPFMIWFYAGVLLSKLILLLGVWLWARRLYASRWAQALVLAGILYPGIWAGQIFYGLDLYYALPLVSFFIYQFLSEGKWRYFSAAASLYAVHLLGNAPYFVPVHSLFIVVSLGVAWLSYPGWMMQAVRRLASWKRMGAGVAAAIACLGAMLTLQIWGIKAMAIQTVGRTQGGGVALKEYLSYGGSFSIFKWGDSLIGAVNVSDITYYLGPVILFGVGYSLLTMRTRMEKFFLIMTAFCLLLTLATPLTVWSYYWPGMKLFRHVPLLDWITRGYIVFWAGVGWDRFLRETPTLWRRGAAALLTALLLGIGGVFLWLAQDATRGEAFLRMVTQREVTHPGLGLMLEWSAGTILFFALLVSALSLFRHKFRIRAAALSALLLLAVGDFYGVRFAEHMNSGSVKMKPQEMKVLDYQPIPYNIRRETDMWQNNPRLEMIAPELRKYMLRYQLNDAFFFHEEPGFSFRNDISAKSVSTIYESFGVMYHAEANEREAARQKYHPAFLKLSGATADKIRFFSAAHRVDAAVLKQWLPDSAFRGDILMLSGSGEASSLDLGADETLDVKYAVSGFNANTMTIETGLAPAGSWLFYSDAWHPAWRAAVNGKEVRVEAAYGGYKAVPLEEGKNRVVFCFEAGKTVWFRMFMALLCLGWTAYVLVRIAGIMAGLDASARSQD